MRMANMATLRIASITVRSVALAALVAFLPVASRADGPVYQAPTPAPESFSPLQWGTKPGFWYSDDQVVRIQGRLDYLEKRAAKECVDVQVAHAGGLPPWVLVTLGIVVGGAAGYFGSRALVKK